MSARFTPEERAARLQARAAKARATGDGSITEARKLSERNWMGQPILVGHHSERKHRSDIAKMDAKMRKGVEAHREADNLERRAQAAAASTVVFSDDTDALGKLRANLAEAEAYHDGFKRVVACLRRTKDQEPRERAQAAIALGVDGEIVRRVVSFEASMGYLPSTTNTGAEVRRLQLRIQELESVSAKPAAGASFDGGRLEEADGRVRFFFDARQPDPVVDALKRAAFKWAPSVGCWQRMLTGNARLAADRLVAELGELRAVAAS